jgi:CheY-like chemotaxis protein
MAGAIRVLLIEDSPNDARMAAEFLGEGSGFELTHVERLSEATARLGKGGFDAVLLDLMLPDSSGLATVSSVHDRAPDLPIIVYSGFGAEDVLFVREAVRGGAQDFLPKSLATPATMQRAIVTSIERKRLEQFRIRHARHDPLTGLANRLLLAERFERAVARAERQGKSLGLLAIEPDHYLRAVEQMGSAFGDELLRAGRRTAECQHPAVGHAGACARARLRRPARGALRCGCRRRAGEQAAPAHDAGFPHRRARALVDRERRHRSVPGARAPARRADRARRGRDVRRRAGGRQRLPGGRSTAGIHGAGDLEPASRGRRAAQRERSS